MRAITSLSARRGTVAEWLKGPAFGLCYGSPLCLDDCLEGCSCTETTTRLVQEVGAYARR